MFAEKLVDQISWLWRCCRTFALVEQINSDSLLIEERHYDRDDVLIDGAVNFEMCIHTNVDDIADVIAWNRSRCRCNNNKNSNQSSSKNDKLHIDSSSENGLSWKWSDWIYIAVLSFYSLMRRFRRITESDQTQDKKIETTFYESRRATGKWIIPTVADDITRWNQSHMFHSSRHRCVSLMSKVFIPPMMHIKVSRLNRWVVLSSRDFLIKSLLIHTKVIGSWVIKSLSHFLLSQRWNKLKSLLLYGLAYATLALLWLRRRRNQKSTRRQILHD